MANLLRPGASVTPYVVVRGQLVKRNLQFLGGFRLPPTPARGPGHPRRLKAGVAAVEGPTTYVASPWSWCGAERRLARRVRRRQSLWVVAPPEGLVTRRHLKPTRRFPHSHSVDQGRSYLLF